MYVLALPLEARSNLFTIAAFVAACRPRPPW